MPDPHVPDFTVALRGYDRQQVDEYVRRLVLDLDEAHARAIDAEQRLGRRGEVTAGSFADLGPHVASLLERADHEAHALRRDADAYAARVREEADSAADDLRALAGSEAATASAQRDALLAEARGRADELLLRSQRHADQRAQAVLSEAATEAAELRDQTADLLAARDEALCRARETAAALLLVADSTSTVEVGS